MLFEDGLNALSLALTDPGFDYSVLSEFRDRLIEGGVEQLLLEKMLSRFKEKDLLKARGKQRTDSTHILAAIRTLNRLELVAETIIHPLNVLATVAQSWLKGWVPAEWFNRYEKTLDEYRLPQEKKERTLFAETIGADGHLLLSMLFSEEAPEWLRTIPAVETMRKIWVQQYYHWRKKDSIPPPAVMISMSASALRIEIKTGRVTRFTRCRYRGLAKTHLQHVLTACAINLKRTVDWLNGKPRSQTRISRFAALAA